MKSTCCLATMIGKKRQQEHKAEAPPLGARGGAFRLGDGGQRARGERTHGCVEMSLGKLGEALGREEELVWVLISGSKRSAREPVSLRRGASIESFEPRFCFESQ
jgi:hypothetical protein